MFKSAKAKASYMMILIFVVYMFDYADRMVVSSLIPYIKEDWHVNDADLGMLTSIVSLFIAIFVLPISVIVDRWSRKKMIAIMVFLWSIATFLCSFADNFTQLLVYRALTGIGEAAYCPAAVALIVKVFPREYRTRYLGIYDAASPIGAGLGLAVGGYIGMILGWRHAFGLLAIPGAILAILFLFVNDYKTQPLSKTDDEFSMRDLFSSLGKLLRVKTLWYVSIAYAGCIAVNTSVMVWSPSFFNRFHNLDKSTSGTVTAAVAVLVLIGSPLGGFLSDWLEKKRPDAKLVIAYISIMVSAIALFAGLWIDNFILSLACFLVFGLSNVTFLAPITSLIQEVVHPGLRAAAFGFNVFIINILGAFLAPILVGAISDNVGLRIGMNVLPVISVLSGVILLFCKNQYFKDKQNVGLLSN